MPDTPYVTDHGFGWGPVEVVCMTEFDRGDRGVTRVIRVTATGRLGRHIDVYVSPKGNSLRVFRDGKELSHA